MKLSDERETPPWLFYLYDSTYRFELDVCATKQNAKCKKFYTIKDNALNQQWAARNWANIPYSGPYPWLMKAYTQALLKKTTVMLLRMDTSTKWFNNLWSIVGDPAVHLTGALYNGIRFMGGSVREIHFLKKRIRFLKNGKLMGSPNFASMVVVFGPPNENTSATKT